MSKEKKSLLTDENVEIIFNRCQVTPDTKKVTTVRVFDPKLCGLESPTQRFDLEKIKSNFPNTFNIFSELKAVRTDTPFIVPDDGFFHYAGNKWTENENSVLNLYSLAIASAIMSPFIKVPKKDAFASDIRPALRIYHKAFDSKEQPKSKPQGETPEKD